MSLNILIKNKIEQIKHCIEYSQEKINQLVYELYELTPAEIAIVENTNNNGNN